ncbi:MAG: YheV family putative metal-binding protein [Oceanicoccus sp.]|uniref:YheV family putative zinc ribbon protein n=1 Tax=Oceanicoccus sp. TaxID=2691044 RepID=UPI0026100780|nr:YheV family putative zinc ribbon protein [Oceanicoccus sp.]MCP3906531.1 YheV family putative metal-binding protein [Oceanicoccus sp.]MDG1773396.1 YheV family putative zinc ribbon protein [Oceanicoccus sp.]
MSEQKIIKRFIAGAVCPRCAEMDKLVMYNDSNGQQIRECVRCGYSDIMTDDGPQAIDVDEVTTRVNQPRLGEEPLAHEDEVQVVSIIDPNPGAKRRDH